jgi:hypothetical protein
MPQSLFLSVLFQYLINKQQELVAKVRKKPEKQDGIVETKTYPFQAIFKNASGRTFFPFGENIIEIAAPEAEPLVKLAAVPGYPPFPSLYPFAYQEEGRSRLAYGLEEGRFFLTFESAGITAHHPQMRKGLAYVFFGLFEDFPFPTQKVGGKFPFFQYSQNADHEFEGHIADRDLPGQESGASNQALGNRDDQGSAGNKGTVFPVPSGLEEIPEGEEDDVSAFFRVQ